MLDNDIVRGAAIGSGLFLGAATLVGIAGTVAGTAGILISIGLIFFGVIGGFISWLANS